MAYIQAGAAALYSRKGNRYKSVSALTAAVGAALSVNDAVLDGEIVYLGPDGTPQCYDLMRRRSPHFYYAFDILVLNGRDLRAVPLIERKRRLRNLIPPCTALSPIRYVEHFLERGVDLFHSVCDRDLEGIVAKHGSGLYRPEATTWGEDQKHNLQPSGGPR
jgi:bifunctional non-homologous end joining protein LigD